MKGIIMAGGEGTRLRPLTCDCPKPMIRLMNRPVMQYALELLKKHGVTDIAATLGYLPDAITDYFGDGADFGVRMTYFVEHSPLGTAGGVRQARDFLNETFIVLSGDGVTDLDIARAARFHRERGAVATLVLKHADNPLEYGVVDLDPQGRVRSFHEKPDWADVASDTVNTGIYILEPEVLDRVPEGRPCDFGRELFPRMVAEGLPVYGFVTEDYWCDVGDVRAYLGAHIDAMEGRVRLDRLAALARGEAFGGRAVQLPGARVDRAAVLEGPCLIDAGAKVCAGAYVGPYSVVGAGCVVGEHASVKRGILWPGARLEPQAQARGCVLASGAILGAGAQAYEESVLGTRARVGARGVLLPGVKLWPGKRTAEGERLDANRVWGGRREPGFIGGCLPVASPAESARAAQACVAALSPREVLIGCADEAARSLWHAAASGVMAQGAQVLDAGVCTLPALRHAQRRVRAEAALFVDAVSVTPLNALGATLPDQPRRAAATLNARQDFPIPAAGPARRPLIDVGAVLHAYAAEIVAPLSGLSGLPKLIVKSANPLARALAERAFTRAGVPVRAATAESEPRVAPGEWLVALDATGEGCEISDESGPLSDAQRQLMAAWLALEAGDRLLIVPASATRGIEALAERRGARVERVCGEDAKWQNALAGRAQNQFDLCFDGLRMAAAALAALHGHGMTLADWRARMPEVHRFSRVVAMPPSRNGRVLHAFAQAQPGAALGGGVRFEHDGGWAWIGADGARPRLRVVAEGASAEFARELCDFCESSLKRLSAEADGKDARE